MRTEAPAREASRESFDRKSNKGYNYPMICALVKLNFRYKFELLHKNRHFEVKTTVNGYLYKRYYGKAGEQILMSISSTKKQKLASLQ